MSIQMMTDRFKRNCQLPNLFEELIYLTRAKVILLYFVIRLPVVNTH